MLQELGDIGLVRGAAKGIYRGGNSCSLLRSIRSLNQGLFTISEAFGQHSYVRGTGCGKSARPGLRGTRRVTGASTRTFLGDCFLGIFDMPNSGCSI